MPRVVVILLFVLFCREVSAFDPRTHLWIAQQVLNDVVPDRTLRIDGKEYVIDAQTVTALRRHPQIFRMGNIGPDAHPDLIVGQSFLHPGSAAGWGADDWAKWLDASAKTDGSLEARAYAAGYWCHMAGDILMHTYVNMYAGDYFVLFDEQEVELRHFALEHYIGDRTPPLKDHQNQDVGMFDLVAPQQFLAASLILNDTAADQYLKYPGYAAHLLAMYRIHKSVHDMRVLVEDFEKPVKSRLDELDRLRADASDKVEKLAARIAMETLSLQPLIDLVEVLKKAVDVQEALNRPIEEAASAAEKAVIAASREVSRIASEIENATRRLETEVANTISSAEREVNRINQEIERWRREVENQTRSVRDLGKLKDDANREVNRLADKLDGILRHLPGYKKVKRELNNARDKLNGVSEQLSKAEDNLRNSIDNVAQLGRQLDEQKNKLTQWVNERVNLSNLIDQLRRAGDLARGELQRANDAVGQLSDGLLAARAALAEKVNPYDEARKKLNELKDLLQRLEDEKNRAIEQIREFGKELRLLVNLSDGFFDVGVSEVLKNWENDLVLATEAYVKAATDALLATMKGEDPLRPIQDWFTCWAPVFTGIPSEALQPGCKAQAYARELAEKIKSLAEELAMDIPIVRDFMREYNKHKEQVTEQLVDGAIDIADHVFGEAFTKFYTLQTKHWKDEDLTKVFSTDSSGKQLLIITDIVPRVRKDLGAMGPDDKFDAKVFGPGIHAITLAKLTMLNIEGIDKLTSNYGISEDSAYVSESVDPMRKPYLYPNPAVFENILFRSVRSIDGNQQWRGIGLPYLRRSGLFENTDRNKFGYCQSDASYNGFRLWTDVNYREKVFSKLFPGELKMKSLAPGLADLIPDALQTCEDTLAACQLCAPDTGAVATVPSAPPAPVIRTAAERDVLRTQRSVQIQDVPFVRLVDRIDGRNQQQVEDAIREETRIKLAAEIREQILDELRHSQRWGSSYDKSYREAEKNGKPLLVIVKVATPSGDFKFDDLVADGLQAKLLDAFVICEIGLEEQAAQSMLRYRPGTILPIAFLIDTRKRQIIMSRADVTTELAWAEVLVHATKVSGRQ
jgi:methyl-accepting chemotaxis protein